MTNTIDTYTPHQRTQKKLEGSDQGPITVTDQQPTGSVPAAIRAHSAVVLVSWISQTFLQLVLLSVIIVGQNVLAASADKRSRATYDDADAILHEAVNIQAHLLAQDTLLGDLVDKMMVVEARLAT